jgi:gamma-glutamyltranspeptidase/glutathione hydrolase
VTRSIAISDDPVAAEAAEDILLSGGSALGAVTAGFFAAAGARSGVLMSPVTLVAAGGGIGARAFDGRCRQPGLGTKRPRGFKENEPIPDAARVAIPASMTAVLVALAYDEQTRVSRVLKTAIRRARDSGAEARAEVLERLRAVGAGAVSEGAFVRSLMHVAGEAAGGLITATDLRSIGDVDVAASTHEESGARWLVAPWAVGEPMEPSSVEGQGTGHAICAVDVRGLFVALSFRRVIDGVSIDEVEIEAPRIAIPVLRGVTRVAPGCALPSPAPVAIRVGEDGVPIEVAAAPQVLHPTSDELASAKLRIRWDAAKKRPEIVKS